MDIEDKDSRPEESQGVEEYARWKELLLEGTSFSDWYLLGAKAPIVEWKRGSWVLFLPTHLDSLVVHFDGKRSTHGDSFNRVGGLRW